MADLKFYPSQRYADKKLAPESMRSETVTALAKAAKTALDTGLLPHDIVGMMLPNLMVENRQDDYGVNAVEMPNSSKTKKVLEALGITDKFFNGSIDDSKNKHRINAAPDRSNWDPKSMEDVYPDQATMEKNAKLVVAALTQKLDTAKRLDGEGNVTADRVIQLWNGTGPGSENHLRKVKEADKMLRTDPTNKSLKDLWDNIVGALPSTSLDEQSAQATSAVLQTMISEYDTNK